jgi:hypothetical protein
VSRVQYRIDREYAAVRLASPPSAAVADLEGHRLIG